MTSETSLVFAREAFSLRERDQRLLLLSKYPVFLVVLCWKKEAQLDYKTTHSLDIVSVAIVLPVKLEVKKLKVINENEADSWLLFVGCMRKRQEVGGEILVEGIGLRVAVGGIEAGSPQIRKIRRESQPSIRFGRLARQTLRYSSQVIVR